MPLLAYIDGEPRRAQPGLRGTCPACETPMLAKCGQIVIWHWAHASLESCDPWRTGETEWHLRWKAWFHELGAEIEVPIRRHGELHIADVRCGDLVVELAGGYPPADQIGEREAFYGNMWWLYNATAFYDRLGWYEKHGRQRFRFRQPVKVLTLHRRPVYWHEPNIEFVERLRWIRRYEQDNGTFRTYGEAEGIGDPEDFLALALSHKPTTAVEDEFLAAVRRAFPGALEVG